MSYYASSSPGPFSDSLFTFSDSLFTFIEIGHLAQWIERGFPKPEVGGSSPSVVTTK